VTLASLNVYLDELRVGDRFAAGSRTITADDLAAYADLTGDRHPLHVDDDFAARGPYGRRVAAGLLTLAVASGLEYPLTGAQEGGIVAFYGLDRVRFPAPVFVGDVVRLEGEVTAIEPRDADTAVVTLRHTIRNERDETVAVYDKKQVYRRAPAA
jgi:3-hydroxybutyryl-CoA dehydratase